MAAEGTPITLDRWSTTEPAPAARSREPYVVAALAFLLTLSAIGGLASTFSRLYDADSYFHLAVAREYAKGTIPRGLPWARFSVLGDGFGDKDLLFHVLLVPFAHSAAGSAGGKVALAFFNALAAAAVAGLAWRAIGRWAVVLPLALLATSADLTLRVLRLRPEILSLVLLLAAVRLAAGRHYRWLGLLAALYVFAHTSFHLLPALCAAWLVNDGLRSRAWRWPLLAWPLLGTALGIVLHPHFPDNVRVWILQNVTRYQYPLPDAGGEFFAHTVSTAFLMNAAWLVALGLLVASRQAGGGGASERDERTAEYLVVAAAVSAALYVFLPRFALYLVPLGTLALFYDTRRRRLAFSRTVRLPYGVRVPLALALAVGAAPFVLRNARVIRGNLESGVVYAKDRESDYRRFAAAVPDGAGIAAPWSETENYVFWAPQGRYLNVLDPIFMAAWRPDLYWRQIELFGGREPDVPFSVVQGLDSDLLATSRLGERPVIPRLLNDPRLVLRHDGYDLLYAVVPGANRDFVVDWRIGPAMALPTGPGDVASWPAYPPAETPRGRAVEGFVDGRRSPTQGCQVFARVETLSAAQSRQYEFAPYGPSMLWLDGKPVVTVLGEPGAVLGRGVVVTLSLSSGPHTMAVQTCPAGGYGGFYLLQRGQH